MKWLETLLSAMRRGKNAFILTGSIGDGFPMRSESNDFLHAWHVIMTSALAEDRPGALCVTYDAALGFDFASQEVQKQFIDLLKSKEKAPEDAPKDAVAKAQEKLSKKLETNIPSDFADAAPLLLRAFTAATVAGKQVITLVHDADAAWMGGTSSNAEARNKSFLFLKRFAENDALQQAGHVLIIAAPSVQSLPETYRRTDSPFTVIPLDRPSESERLAFLERVCEQPMAEGAEDAAVEPEPEPLPTVRPFVKEIWARHLDGSKAPKLKALDATSWSKLSEGDVVIFRIKNGAAIEDIVKSVIEIDAIGVLLSKSDDLLAPAINKKKDGKAACFVLNKDGVLMQRFRESDSELVPFKLPPNTKLHYLTAAQAAPITKDLDDAYRSGQSVPDGGGPAPIPFVKYGMPTCGVQMASRLTTGMSYRDMKRMLISSKGDGRPCGEPDILEARRDILVKSFGHMFDFVEPAYGFEGIAGCEHIKDLLMDARDKIAQGLLVRVPQGVLLMGPPGTGKTAVAEAFARECGYLFVKLKNQRNMYVGETERQMEEMVSALRQLAPVVVLRDEVDQEDSGRDAYQGDSGVSARVRQTWMTFLSDPFIRGRVFVISATNRPDLLDAALKRSGRTDERIALTMPDEETRSVLFDVMFRRIGKGIADLKLDWDRAGVREWAVEATNGFSGADIEVIVRHAIDAADAKSGHIVVTPDSLKYAISNFVASDAKEQIAKMELAAISACSKLSHRPRDWEKLVARHYETLGHLHGFTNLGSAITADHA